MTATLPWRTAVWAGVLFIVIVLFVQAFTAEGAPSAPVVAPVSVVDGPGGTGSVYVAVLSSVYSNQAPNGIDDIPPIVEFNAWTNGQLAALQGQAPLTPFDDRGDAYTFGRQFGIALPFLCPELDCHNTTIQLTIAIRAIVPTWVATYSSPWVWANFTFSPDPGAIPTTPPLVAGPPPAGHWTMNWYGAWLGMGLAISGAYTATTVERRGRFTTRLWERIPRRPLRLTLLLAALLILLAGLAG